MEHPLNPNLLTPGILDEQAILAFKFGACGALAIAIHDATGWPIVALVDQNKSVLHWTVLRSDGMLIDIEGSHSQAELLDEYSSDIDDGGQAAILPSTRAYAADYYAEYQRAPIPIELAATYVEILLKETSS